MTNKSEVKVYLIKGYYRQRNKKIRFSKELRALKEADALEKLYCDIGSRHRIKRNLFHIEEISIITSPEEIKTDVIRQLTEAEADLQVYPRRSMR
ncbi:MAG: 50S ribosomal protein L18Ae [Candidatus Hermodarchaeota archaeon]